MSYGGLNTKLDATPELGRNPVNKHQIQPDYGDEPADLGANGDREISIFPVQLTTSRIGNLTRFILTLAICVTCIPCILKLVPVNMYQVLFYSSEH